MDSITAVKCRCQDVVRTKFSIQATYTILRLCFQRCFTILVVPTIELTFYIDEK